jgi:hypothetical protein
VDGAQACSPPTTRADVADSDTRVRLYSSIANCEDGAEEFGLSTSALFSLEQPSPAYLCVAYGIIGKERLKKE